MNLYLAVLAKSSKGKYWELAFVAQNVVNAAFMEICARAAMSAREKYSMHQRANHALFMPVLLKLKSCVTVASVRKFHVKYGTEQKTLDFQMKNLRKI